MSSLLTEGDLTHEAHVVWLEDPDKLDYVRQALDKTPAAATNPATPATAAWSATPNSTTTPKPTRTAACTAAASFPPPARPRRPTRRPLPRRRPRRSRGPAHYRGQEGGREDPALAKRTGSHNRLPLLDRPPLLAPDFSRHVTEARSSGRVTEARSSGRPAECPQSMAGESLESLSSSAQTGRGSSAGESLESLAWIRAWVLSRSARPAAATGRQ